MKLKYLFLATIAAGMMMSCSNDDDPQPIPGARSEINLSIGASLGADSRLRADDTNALPGEAKINRLTAFLFQGPELKKVKDTLDIVDETALNRIGNIVVPAGPYDIFIVANADADILTTVTNLATFESYTGALASQAQNNLLMVSDKLSADLQPIVKDGENLRLTYCYLPQNETVESSETPRAVGSWYTKAASKPVELVRLASRVQLESITLDFKEDLAGSTFVLKGVYLANVRPETKLTPVASSFEAGTSYVGGIKRATDADELIAGYYTETAALAKTYNQTISSSYAFLDTDRFFGYVFENQTTEARPDSYATRMIIAGNVITPSGVDRGLRYYQVDIADGELARNNIYKVNLTIAGLGSTPPGKKEEYVVFDAKLTVEGWAVIDHVEDITD